MAFTDLKRSSVVTEKKDKKQNKNSCLLRE